jgi:hypothetical protein
MPFILNPEKFAGDKLRVMLRVLKVIDPIIDRKYTDDPKLTNAVRKGG